MDLADSEVNLASLVVRTCTPPSMQTQRYQKLLDFRMGAGCCHCCPERLELGREQPSEKYYDMVIRRTMITLSVVPSPYRFVCEEGEIGEVEAIFTERK